MVYKNIFDDLTIDHSLDNKPMPVLIMLCLAIEAAVDQRNSSELSASTMIHCQLLLYLSKCYRARIARLKSSCFLLLLANSTPFSFREI